MKNLEACSLYYQSEDCMRER